MVRKEGMWHDNEHSGVCLYIYIYYGCVSGVSVCCGWLPELSPASLKRCWGVEDLSILARGPHKELCPREPARPEERTDVGPTNQALDTRQRVEARMLSLAVKNEDTKQ